MLQPVMPLVYEVVNPAIKQTTVADLLLDVFGPDRRHHPHRPPGRCPGRLVPRWVPDALAAEFLQRRRK